MGIITDPNDLTTPANKLARASDVEAKIDVIITEVNGNLDDANLKSNANIQQSKVLNLTSDITARLLLTGGQLTGRLDIKMATPYLRLIGTEASAKDWRLVEDAGSLKLQENTGTESTPTWTTRATLPASTAGFYPHIGRGLRENLILTRTNASAVNVTADAATLLDSNGGQIAATSISVSPNLSVSGANGLDAGTEAADTWYYIWLIHNGTAVAGLFSTSATAPTMPSGYTHKLLVGAARNNTTSDLLAFKQVGSHYQFDAPILVGDNVASTTTAALSLATAVPPSRVKGVWGKVNNTSGTARVFYWDGITFANSQVQNNSVVAFSIVVTIGDTSLWSLPILREAQTMYIQASATNILDIWLSAFSFDW